MKNLLFFLAIICCTAAKANRINLNPYQWSDKGRVIGAGFCNPGDTLTLSGAWNYLTVTGLQGNAQHHILIINTDSLNMTAGVSIEGTSRYIDVSGVKSGSFYLFKVHDNRNYGTGLTAKNLTKNISFRNIEVYDKAYGSWIKNESNTTNCDSTQWYPHYQDSIFLEYCYIHDCNQEGLYAGSTDPGGLASERAVSCFGMVFTPRSSALKNIFVRYNVIINTGRTNIQISAESFGVFEVSHNICKNAGFDLTTQWPNIWIGGESQAFGTIAYNDLDTASRNNITYYGNNAYIHDNTASNAGVVRNINTGVISKFSYYSNVTVSIRSTHPYTKTCFKIKNNSFTPTGANSAIYLEGNATDYTDTGNYICNSGTIGLQDNNIKFYNGCAGGDTSTTTVKVPCDTPRRGTFHKLILYDSIVPLKDTMILKTYENGKRFYYVHTKQDKVFHNSKDSTYDSTFICPKCGNCDSLIYNINVNKLYGLMPFKTANDYGIENTRDQLNVRFFKTQKQNKIRIRNYDAGHVTLNLSTKNLDTSKANYLTDTVAYKTMVKDAVDSFPNIKKYVIENEEGNQNYFTPGQDISLYCNMFKAALNQLNSQGITDVTNGGLIWIRFWYYGKTHDADFFNTCFNSIQRSAWNNGNLAYKTQQVTYEIDFLKNLATLKKINIHQLYVSDTSEFAGLVRMVDYLKSYTGKQVTSNEVGYYVDDANILSGLFVMALLENFDDLIYYSGDGSDDALPIPQDQIKLIL